MIPREGAGRLPDTFPAGLIAAALLLLAWTSVMLPGFAFPWVNNAFHVPIVLGYAASAEGPHDAFTQSLDNFVSGFWPALGLVANEGNIFWVFFAAHALGRLLFVVGLYGLIRQLGAGQRAALALTGLASIAPIFKGVSTVGHTETLATYLSHTGFAIAMLPGCWWLLLRGRWIAGAAALGLIFNVNAFLSVWSVAAAVAALIVVRPEGWLRKLLFCGAAYTVAALPTLIWTLSTIAQPSQPIDFRAYLLDYYPYHTFVHVQWDAAARYLAFLVATALAVWAAYREMADAKVIAVLFAAYVAVFLFGIPLPYLTGSRLLLNLYPLRIDAVINVAAAAITLGWAGRSLSGDRDTLPLAISLALLTANAVAVLLLLHAWCRRAGRLAEARIAAVALAGTVLLLLAMRLSPTLGQEFAPLSLLFCGATLCAAAADRRIGKAYLGAIALALACGFVADGYPWPPTADRIALLAVGALLLLGLIVMLKPGRRLSEFAVAPTTLLAGLAAIGLALTAYAGWRGSVERPDADLGPELEAQAWTRRTLAPDTPFLPVGVTAFSLMSRRPAWVDGQAGAAAMWKPDFYREWRPRMHELRACADTACYAALARRHRIGWIVANAGALPGASRAGLHLRFTNRRYAIYSVDGLTPAAPAKGG